MPYTLSHTFAAVPLRALCRRGVLTFPVLLLGCLVPDVGFYVGAVELAEKAHSLLGLFTVCLPVGIVMTAVFYVLLKPLLFVLPNPHRQFLCDCPSLNRLPIGPNALAAVCLSLLVGSASHVLWDQFTQPGGWFVDRVAWLRRGVMVPGLREYGLVPVYWVVQHVSTVLGMAGFLGFYGYWLLCRRQEQPHPYFSREFDVWRWVFWLGLLVGPAVVMVRQNLPLLGEEPDFFRLRIFLFHAGVTYTACFMTALVSGSVFIYWFWKTKAAHRAREAGPV